MGEPMVPAFDGLANIDPSVNQRFYRKIKKLKSVSGQNFMESSLNLRFSNWADWLIFITIISAGCGMWGMWGPGVESDDQSPMGDDQSSWNSIMSFCPILKIWDFGRVMVVGQ
jgi:hypothetical protein